MSIIASFIIGLVIGAVGGFLVGFLMYRNNAKKLQDTESQIKNIGG